MFGDLFDIVKDVVDDTTEIVTAPVKIAGHTVRKVTKPLAETAHEMVEAFKGDFDD